RGKAIRYIESIFHKCLDLILGSASGLAAEGVGIHSRWQNQSKTTGVACLDQSCRLRNRLIKSACKAVICWLNVDRLDLGTIQQSRPRIAGYADGFKDRITICALDYVSALKDQCVFGMCN